MADECSGYETIENEFLNGEEERDDIDSDEFELKMEKHVDFIDINKDGWTLLGASSLTSRLWTGGVWLFRQPGDTDNVDKCAAYYRVDSGVACGKFVDGLAIRAVFGQDSGQLELVGWEPLESEHASTAAGDDDERRGDVQQQRQRQMVRHGCVTAHDDGVLCLDTATSMEQGAAGGDAGSETTVVVTGGADGCVQAWDLETMTPLSSYPGAHQHCVTGVSCHPAHPSRFATCSLDGYVLLWDMRSSKPAKVLDCLAANCAECLSWSPLDGISLAVGLQSGTVGVYNTVSGSATRSSDVTLSPMTPHRRPVHALCWSGSGRLACCSDTTVVTVMDVNADSVAIRYTNDSNHSDMVRGLCWYDPHSTKTSSTTLYSCGWDGRVTTHTIT